MLNTVVDVVDVVVVVLGPDVVVTVVVVLVVVVLVVVVVVEVVEVVVVAVVGPMLAFRQVLVELTRHCMPLFDSSNKTCSGGNLSEGFSLYAFHPSSSV